MALADATAAVVQQVFAHLIRDGVLSREIFETIAAAHDQMASETANSRRKVEASDVAVVARLILDLADPPLPKPGLTLVRNEPTNDE